MITEKVISVQSLGKRKVRNLLVDKNHTIITSDGVVTHNCNSAQPALRNFMEEHSANCTFILTCNFKNRIIAPLHSRCKVIDFKIHGEEKPKLAAEFFKRISAILKKEGVEYDKKAVAEVVNQHFPDFRRVINELQSYAVSGRIDTGILVNITEESYNTLFTALKDKKFNEVRKWVANHSDQDSSEIFKTFYDLSSEKLVPKSLPQLILLLGQYQYQAAFVANPEINLAAFMTECMLADLQWQ